MRRADLNLSHHLNLFHRVDTKQARAPLASGRISMSHGIGSSHDHHCHNHHHHHHQQLQKQQQGGECDQGGQNDPAQMFAQIMQQMLKG